MPTLQIETTENDLSIVQQALQNQFDMEDDMFHDNAWLDVASFRGMAGKSDIEIQREIKRMRDSYSNNLDRLLALQRFIITLENR